MTKSNGHKSNGLAEIERQARMLASDNREAEPSISKILWFPDAQEVRLVEVDVLVPSAGDGEVHPFYFRPSPEDGLPSPSAVALISPQDYRQARLPDDWGNWDDAMELELAG